MDGEVVIGINMDTKGFDIQIATVEEELEKLIEDYKELKETKPFEGQQKGLQELQKKIEQTRNKLVDLKKKQQDLDNANLSKIPASLNGIGNGIESVIKKITRWGLALFGIRSMYNFIRGSVSTLSGYNEKMATDIEYIRFALASTLQPVIERIIQLAYTLLQYIGYIAKAWFGVNIFANASAKAFNKNNKAIAGSAGSAKKLNKELQKTLAGFDEMNVLQDNNNNDSDTGGGGSVGGGGVSVPSMDLSNWEKVKMPKWVEWIAKNKNLILGFFKELGILILAIKIGEFIIKLAKTGEFISKIIKFLKPLLTIIGQNASLIGGIIALVGGLIIFIKGIIDYLKNPTWENFAKILAGIAVIAAGVFLLFGGFPAIIAAIVGAVIALGVAIYKNWDKIKQTLAKAGAWISNLWTNIVNGAKTAVNNIKNFFGSIPSFFSGIVNRITGFFRNLGYTAGNVIGAAFKSVVNGVLRTIENILNTPIRTINSLISTINRISPVKIGKLSTFSLPRLAKGGIVNMPSRGVPIGGAIAGERGQEGVIPLTDSQQMALLGEAIGRYITVELTNVTQLDGRQIARKVEQINQNNRFVLNR